MNDTAPLLLALLIIFTVPWLAWRLMGGDRIAPLVVVQIMAGILLGPAILGSALPVVHEAVFSPVTLDRLYGLAAWAVMLFVFVAGIEVDIAHAWRERRDALTTSGLALATPLALGSLAAILLLADPRWIGPQGAPWQFVAGLGMACAVTALPILILFLERLEILRTALGQRILRYASLDDVAVWGVLAVILLDTTRLGKQALFLALFALGAWGARRLFSRLGDADRWPLALGWLLLVAAAADWAGLHYMVGAFLAGAVLDAAWFGTDRLDNFRDRVLMLLMPVFFLSTGLRTRWDLGGLDVLGAALLLLFAAVVGKLVGVRIAARVLGWPAGQARLVGWLLQTKALIMIIFANILLDEGVISATSFTALVLMAVLSTLLTMPMTRKLAKSVSA